MPAHVTIELNEDTLAQIVKELDLSKPPSFTLNHSGQFAKREMDVGGKGERVLVRGSYHAPTNLVTITSQGESYEREGLYVLTKHIRFTVLHELRHAWQREHWTAEQKRKAAAGPYHLRFEEIDANQWADYASPKYRTLVQIKRRQVGRNGFSRLGTGTS